MEVTNPDEILNELKDYFYKNHVMKEKFPKMIVMNL